MTSPSDDPFILVDMLFDDVPESIIDGLEKYMRTDECLYNLAHEWYQNFTGRPEDILHQEEILKKIEERLITLDPPHE